MHFFNFCNDVEIQVDRKQKEEVKILYRVVCFLIYCPLSAAKLYFGKLCKKLEKELWLTKLPSTTSEYNEIRMILFTKQIRCGDHLVINKTMIESRGRWLTENGDENVSIFVI